MLGVPSTSGSYWFLYSKNERYVGGMMYSSATVASGKFGENESCWKVVYGLICAVARETSSSVEFAMAVLVSIESCVVDSEGGEAIPDDEVGCGSSMAGGVAATPMVTFTDTSSSALAAPVSVSASGDCPD